MSERTLTTAVKNALNVAEKRPFIMVEMDFSSSPLRLWTGTGSLTWDSKTWTGSGDMGTISPIEETDDVRATGLSLTLNGIDAALISTALGEKYQGRAVKIWLGFFDDNWAVIADPVLVYTGRMDIMNIAESGDTASITVKVENRLIDLERPRERRYTDEDQKIDYPGDLAFEYVAGLQDARFKWG